MVQDTNTIYYIASNRPSALPIVGAAPNMPA